MTVCASLMVLSEPITFNIQMLITHLIIVISQSHTHMCSALKGLQLWSKKKFHWPETPIKKILIIFFIML